MEKNDLKNLMDTTMTRIREMVDVNTIIGEQISTPDGTTIIPVSKVAFGFGCGGGEYQVKGNPEQNFGGGSGAGITIQPVAFLIVSGGNVKLVPVAAPANTTVDRIVELVPEILEKAGDFLDRRKEEKKDIFE